MRRKTAQTWLVVLGLAPWLTATALADTGGASSTPAPSVTAVKCKTECSAGYAKAGSVVALSGTELQDVAGVAFAGDKAAVPQRTSKKRVLVKVPRGAVTGPVLVADSMNQVSAPSPTLKIRKTAVPKRTGGPISTVVTGRKAFVDGEKPPVLTFRLDTPEAAEVVVSVVRRKSGKTVKTFAQGAVDPGELREVAFTGRAGRYAFVVSAVGDGVRATTAQAEDANAFRLLGHKFPVRGKHDYGEGAARFGTGRRGHSHQGQDVFARCGTPLVAARGGTVKISRYQGNAGNYVVIDGAGTDVDHFYAHLTEKALVEKGARVRTGQLLGYVGDTGNARGCHLHFEAWDGPGWYTGGKPFDPLPDLQAWDAVS